MRHVLDRKMRLLLARMELFLSYGTSQAWDKSGSRGKPSGGDRPAGDSAPVHEFWAAVYSRCDTNQERENVIRAATEDLRDWLVGKAPVSPEPGSLHWKRQIAESDEPVERVLHLYGISRATYFRYRRDYRRDVA